MKTLNSVSSSTLAKNGFTTVLINSENISQVEMGIIHAYKDVFNASSWREGVKCSLGCGFKTTFEDAPNACPLCSGDIVDFYSDEEVSSSIRSILDKSYFQFLILLSGKKVAGFSWGWTDSLENINNEKLGLNSEVQFPKLIQTLQSNAIQKDGQFYYLSEVGMIPEYRGKGIGQSLIYEGNLILKAESNSIDSIILRTSRSSPMYKIQSNLGSKEVFSYEDQDKRIILAKNNF